MPGHGAGSTRRHIDGRVVDTRGNWPLAHANHSWHSRRSTHVTVLTERARVRRRGAAHPDFAGWVASRQHELLRAAYLITGDLHRAEDLLQEAFIKVGSRWHKLRDGNPDAYIRTILYRDHISWWRRRRETPMEHIHDTEAPGDPDTTEHTLVVRNALATLTTKQRAVLVLRYFDDLTERETADILGVSIGTVKSQTAPDPGRLRDPRRRLHRRGHRRPKWRRRRHCGRRSARRSPRPQLHSHRRPGRRAWNRPRD